MNKILLIAVLFLLGCTNQPVRIKTEIQEVKVPILYCPAPPNIEKPLLPIHQMTTQQKNNQAEVAKHYAATIKVLFGYIKQLELALQLYDETSKSYDSDLLQQLAIDK